MKKFKYALRMLGITPEIIEKSATEIFGFTFAVGGLFAFDYCGIRTRYKEGKAASDRLKARKAAKEENERYRMDHA